MGGRADGLTEEKRLVEVAAGGGVAGGERLCPGAGADPSGDDAAPLGRRGFEVAVEKLGAGTAVESMNTSQGASVRSAPDVSRVVGGALAGRGDDLRGPVVEAARRAPSPPLSTTTSSSRGNIWRRAEAREHRRALRARAAERDDDCDRRPGHGVAADHR